MIALLVWAAVLLYIFPPLWMLVRKGWPIRAGLTMLAASLLLLLPMIGTVNELPPAAGILAFAFVPFVLLAIAVICGGLIAALVRSYGRRAPRSYRVDSMPPL